MLATAAVVVAATAACGAGEDTDTGAKANATRSTTSTTVAPTTTTTASASASASGSASVANTKTTTRPAATTTFARPADAVRHLYEAWRKGDRGAAGTAATAAAVGDLFARSASNLSGSECTRSTGDTRCFMDGEGFSAIFEVAANPRRGYQVQAVSFATHESAQASPTAVASPGRAAVGDTVRLQGEGFVGDPYNAEDAPFYLVGGSSDCALYAMARDTLVVDDNGRLSGTFVVPATGDCRMAGREAPVTPGKYQLAYACTACIVGEFEVVAGR